MMSKARLTLCAMAVMAMTACSSLPSRDGTSPLPDLPADKLRMDDRWSSTVGSGADNETLHLAPTVLAPYVYAASADGRVRAFGRATGNKRWTRDFPERITAGVGGGDGAVAIATAQSKLVLMDAKTGNTLWTVDLGANLLSTPIVSANEVIVQTLDGRVQVFERADGKRRWQFNTPVPPLSLRGNAAPLLSGDKVFAVSGQGDLYQLDLNNGLPIWQTRVTNSRGRGEIERLMDIDGDLVIDEAGTLYTAGFQSQLTATDTVRVGRRWQLNISTTQQVGLDGAHVYAVDIDGTIAGVNRVTGELVWLQEGLKGRKLLAPVIWRGLVAVGDGNGYVHLMSPVDGRIRGRVKASSDPLMSVVVDAPQLLTLSADGDLRAWDLITDK